MQLRGSDNELAASTDDENVSNRHSQNIPNGVIHNQQRQNTNHPRTAAVGKVGNNAYFIVYGIYFSWSNRDR